MLRRPRAQAILALPGVALLAVAGYWPARLALADWWAQGDSPLALRRAIQLAPGDAEYRVRLADLLASQRLPARAALEAALARNPRHAGAWMRLGLLAETQGDPALGEQCLLQAARVSSQYEPRWTLANFYFRRQRTEAFWHWARLALAMSYGDRAPLFQLCWETTRNPEIILERALADQPSAVWVDYLRYLLAQQRLEAVPPAAARGLDSASPEDLELLLRCTNALLEARQPRPALAVWNRLCSRKLLSYPELFPERGESLTNGAFRSVFVDGGFDWRVPRTAGIESARTAAGFRASFSGRQPEDCEVLWQYLPVEPGRRYALIFEYQTESIPPESGLRWRVLEDGTELAAGSPALSSARWNSAGLTFSAPDSTRLARLVLAYRRAPGTARVEGAVALRGVVLRMQP